MNVVIQIQGRAAVPVRAIPLMTNWIVMAGSELVGIFSRNGKAGEVQRLTAYHLVDGVVTLINVNFWVDAGVALASVTETMKAKNRPYREWQLRALQELPDVGFVWLDELEFYFAQQYCDADNDSAAEYFQIVGIEENLVPAMLGLHFSPLIPTEFEVAVMQGFPEVAHRGLTAAPNSTEVECTAPALRPATPAPVVAALVEPDKAGPVPVTTRAMADSFAGLHWNGEQWIKKLGNNSVWVDACKVLNRGRGEGMRLWNPVRIGAYLVRMGHVKANSVRARFQTQTALIPWLDDWKTYEADNHPTD